MSSGSATRPSGVSATRSSRTPGRAWSSAVMPVSTNPGNTALIRMPSGAYWMAAARVRARAAPFDAW